MLSQDTLLIGYEDAIRFALYGSFTIKQYENQKEASKHNYLYYQNQFKPRLDAKMNIPVWNEYVNRIDQPDGLPVYNSYGSLELGGLMSFQYILPTGGNVSLSGNLFRENLNTLLSKQDKELYTEQFYSRFWLSFEQPVFTKNRLKENLKEAEYRYEKSMYYFTRSQMDIIYLVTQKFYQLYRASEEVNIALEKLENAKESYRVALLKSETGRIPAADVLSAEVSVARDEALLLRAKNQRATEEDELKLLLGIDLQKTVNIVTDLDYQTFLIDENLAISKALENRFELKEDKLDIALQKIEIDRAKREKELKGSISAYYDLTGISTIGTGSTVALMQSSFNDISNRPPNRGVAFSVSFPIYDWGRGRERLQVSQLMMKEKKLMLENQENTIVKEVRDVVRKVRESHEQIEIHKKNLELARRSYKISNLRFENGDISNQELSIERERLASIQLDYLDAFITYQLSVNNLKRRTMWDFENNKSYLPDDK